MYQVKGPITFIANGEIPKEITDVIGEIKLPFTATNFKYSNRKLDGKKFMFADGTKIVANTGIFLEVLEPIPEPIGDVNL